MKLLSAIFVAASVGTCSVGGQQRLPPSPAEQAAAAKTPAADVASSDPWQGIPDECRQLASSCDECDEVQRMRRQIEYKRCMPVCDAYLDRTDVLVEVPQEAISLLQRPQACGKTETTCSTVEQSQCEYMIGYTTAGVLFRSHFAEGTTSDKLAEQVREEFLAPYLDHHDRVISWASSNDVDSTSMIALGGELFETTSSELIGEVTRGLASAADPALPAISALIDLIRYPGDSKTFDARRRAAEADFAK